MNQTLTLIEVSRLTGIDELEITTWIEREWLNPPISEQLDSQDLARLQLIQDLIYRLGANEEAIPVILHLVDQLCHVQEKLSQLR